jgi:hypothetical protein
MAPVRFLTSCSQNVAYSATIMAAQIRSAKARVEAETRRR